MHNFEDKTTAPLWNYQGGAAQPDPAVLMMRSFFYTSLHSLIAPFMLVRLCGQALWLLGAAAPDSEAGGVG